VLEQIIAHVNDFGDVLLPRLRNCERVAQTGRGMGCDSRPEAAPGTQQLGAVALFAVSPANADHSEALDHRQISVAGTFLHVRGSGGHDRSSSKAGRPAKDSRTWSGVPLAWRWTLGRYLPVLTRTPVSPWRWAARTSVSMSSPTISVSAASAPSCASAVAKNAAAGLPTTSRFDVRRLFQARHKRTAV
jgi:hypothetical protein